MAALTAQHITKRYGKGDSAFTALSDVSLSIEAGESVAIVGKSGSGKSTLLHMLALLDKPTSGNVFVADKEAGSLSSKQLGKVRNKRYGFVFQQFFLNDKDSVLGNVVLPLKIAGVSRAERNKRGMEALKAVELEQKAKAKAGTLSGGQKQRACIARALINNPNVIFADEPTGNLDSHTSKVVEDLLFKLNKLQNITLIIVTHDDDLAARCNRQLHIKDGALVRSNA
ncbi:MAG TPA: ABC transporter ATP-binding protein [Candidatus Saccharimonadales bacterium]